MMRKIILPLITVVLLCLMVLPAGAREPVTSELSLNDAITRAFNFNKTVKKAAKQVDLAELERDQREKDLGYITGGATGEPMGESAYAGLLSANLTWRMSGRNLTAAQDALTLSVCDRYWAVQLAENNLQVAQLALRQANMDLNKARAYHAVGMTAADVLLAAETQQAAAKYALEKAQNDVATAYTAFNQLVGLWAEDRPVLTDELSFTPLDDVNLDVLVARVLDDSPMVWQADQRVELQKHLKDLMFYTGSYQPYDARVIEMTQVELDALSAREATEILTRNMYYGVRSLEVSYPAAVQAVKLAEENLRIGQAKYEVGMATPTDVIALEAAVAQSQQSLLELMKNHAYYVLALEKPWAVQG